VITPTKSASAYSQPFWDGVAAEELRLPWCLDCGKAHFPPRPFCPHCWSDSIEWRQASGRGSLYTYTLVQANPPSAFVDVLPYAIGVIDLEEGVRMMSHIEGDPEKLGCDANLELTWIVLHDERLPAFTVVEEGGS
jgi:uncharacterized OB-fold protein